MAGCRNGAESLKISTLFLQIHKGFPLCAWRGAEILQGAAGMFASERAACRAETLLPAVLFLYRLNNPGDHLTTTTESARIAVVKQSSYDGFTE